MDTVLLLLLLPGKVYLRCLHSWLCCHLWCRWLWRHVALTLPSNEPLLQLLLVV
jgi:hypothetical protein